MEAARALAEVEPNGSAIFSPVHAIRPEGLQRHPELPTDHSDRGSHHPARDFEVASAYLDVEAREQRAEPAMHHSPMAGSHDHSSYVSDTSHGRNFDAARILGRKHARRQDDPARGHRVRPVPADDVHGALVVGIALAQISEIASAAPSGSDDRIGSQLECRGRLAQLLCDGESQRGAVHNGSHKGIDIAPTHG